MLRISICIFKYIILSLCPNYNFASIARAKPCGCEYQYLPHLYRGAFTSRGNCIVDRLSWQGAWLKLDYVSFQLCYSYMSDQIFLSFWIIFLGCITKTLFAFSFSTLFFIYFFAFLILFFNSTVFSDFNFFFLLFQLFFFCFNYFSFVWTIFILFQF